ncbi:hypothetical protein LCGC14_0251720 [marine sediment metagenome]|uniref:Uncharacterized protein n=1 Tax=marine sediment metagenome TaxID=412755 RepID=A0A0F9U4D4_9ZZZZ
MTLAELVRQLEAIENGNLVVRVWMPDGSGSRDVTSVDFDDYPVYEQVGSKKKVKQVTLYLE